MTKMTPTLDYPKNNFETPHHRNLKTERIIFKESGERGRNLSIILKKLAIITC
jgi:hypothetical protein